MFKKTSIFLVGAIFTLISSAYSQINKDDEKKLTKADEYIKVGDKLVEEATTLYLETFKIKSDTKLSEKEINKRCNKLEREANKKQLKANEYYNIGYDLKIGIYKIYITKIIQDKKDTEITENLKIKIEEINEYLIKAREFEIKANKIKDEKEKILLLNNAREQRMKAFEVAEQTYKLCYEMPGNYHDEYNVTKNVLSAKKHIRVKKVKISYKMNLRKKIILRLMKFYCKI